MAVVLDEGGARCSDGDTRTYVPYAAMGDVELESRVMRSPAVVVTMSSGERFTLFAGRDALELHRGLVEHLAARAAHASAAAPAEWARGDRTLSEWLESSAADAGSGGYRAGSDFTGRALAIFDDANADIEARAVAACLLVKLEDPSTLVAVAKVLLGRPLPPLVIAAAAMGAIAMIDRTALDEAMPFLSAADRVELEQRLRSAAPATKDQADAVSAARHMLSEEALRAPPAEHDEHARRTAGVIGVSRDMGRWIGRSWGL